MRTTYLVTSLEAVSLHAGVGVGLHADACSVHGAEHVVHLADQLLVLGVDHASKQGHAVAVNHADKVTFARVRESSNLNDGSGGSLLETSETATAATTTTATASVTASESTTASVTAKAASSSRFKSHLLSFSKNLIIIKHSHFSTFDELNKIKFLLLCLFPLARNDPFQLLLRLLVHRPVSAGRLPDPPPGRLLSVKGLLDQLRVLSRHKLVTLAKLLSHIHVDSLLLVVVGSLVGDVVVPGNVGVSNHFLVFFVLHNLLCDVPVSGLDGNALVSNYHLVGEGLGRLVEHGHLLFFVDDSLVLLDHIVNLIVGKSIDDVQHVGSHLVTEAAPD